MSPPPKRSPVSHRLLAIAFWVLAFHAAGIVGQRLLHQWQAASPPAPAAIFTAIPVTPDGLVEFPGARWWVDLPFQWNAAPAPGSDEAEVIVAEDPAAQIRILEFRNRQWGEYRYQQARLNGRWTPHGPYVRFRDDGGFTVAFYDSGQRVGSEREYAADGSWQRAWQYTDGMTDYGRGARLPPPRPAPNPVEPSPVQIPSSTIIPESTVP